MKKLKYIGDLFLLAFWSIAYFLKTIIEIPYLWIKSKWMVAAVVILLTGCNIYHSPNGKEFPYGWGSPPEIQTKDYVELPYGYGHGSSTLKHWIVANKRREDIIKALNGDTIPSL